MSLKQLLTLSQKKSYRKRGISEQRLDENMEGLRKIIAYYRWYPDVFVDHIKGTDSKFVFYPYQRIFLRAVMRHKYVYGTFPRAFSKSFLAMMALMLRCILFPNSYLFVTTGGE